MSVLAAFPANSGLSGQTRGTDASSATRGHRATFRVSCAAGDTWDIIDKHFRSTGSLPYPGRIFDVGNGQDTRSRCNELRGTQIENGEGRWLVEATFEESTDTITLGQQGQDGKPSDDPDDWHDEIEVSTTQMSMAVERALYLGNSIGTRGPNIFPGRWYKPSNSGGKPLEPGIDEELDITVLRITKFQRGYSAAFYVRYINTVNSGIVFIHKPDYGFSVRIGPQTAKMKAINSTYHVTPKGIKYWKHTVEIHINMLTWRRQILDRGTEERLRSGDTRRDGTLVTASHLPSGFNFVDEAIKDGDGMAISEPVNFDGKGRAWKEADRPPVFLFWQTLREEDWSQIPW